MAPGGGAAGALDIYSHAAPRKAAPRKIFETRVFFEAENGRILRILQGRLAILTEEILLLPYVYYRRATIFPLLHCVYYLSSTIFPLLSPFYYHPSTIFLLLHSSYYPSSTIFPLLSSLYWSSSTIFLLLSFLYYTPSTILPPPSPFHYPSSTIFPLLHSSYYPSSTPLLRPGSGIPVRCRAKTGLPGGNSNPPTVRPKWVPRTDSFDIPVPPEHLHTSAKPFRDSDRRKTPDRCPDGR